MDLDLELGKDEGGDQYFTSHLFSLYLYSTIGLRWVVLRVWAECDCCLCVTVVQKSLCLF